MSNDSTAVDFGINLFEQEIDDVIFRTNEFLTDATFTGGQGPFWWLLVVAVTKSQIHKFLISYLFALHIEASYSLLIRSTNSSGVSISIFEKPNHFLPKSFMDAPM